MRRQNFLLEVRLEFSWEGYADRVSKYPKKERKRRLTDKFCETGTHAASHAKLKKIGEDSMERRVVYRKIRREASFCAQTGCLSTPLFIRTYWLTSTDLIFPILSESRQDRRSVGAPMDKKDGP